MASRFQFKNREQGTGQKKRQKGDPPYVDPIENDRIAELLSKKMRAAQRHMQQNARAYAAYAARKRSPTTPRYILSDFGLVQNGFTWQYAPPANASYWIIGNGKKRPWRYIFLHSFGYTWDNYHMGIGKRSKKSGRFALVPPGDADGFHPSRWYSAWRELCSHKDWSNTRVKNRKVSIHFMISRRGDVVVSCDLNDMAFHGAGERSMNPSRRGANNYFSVGFELEPMIYREAPRARTKLANYTEKQMRALAIIVKKLSTIRPIAQHVVSKNKSGSIASQVKQSSTGYIQHKDVNSGKSDAGAQFDILPGNKGSGWDHLWGLMDKLRFNLATDVFVTKLPDLEIQAINDLTVAMSRKTSHGQKAAIHTQRDRLQGFRRAAQLQAKTRRDIYKGALGQTFSLHKILAQSTATISQLASRFSTSSILGVTGPVQTYSEDTGTWFVGGADSSKSV